MEIVLKNLRIWFRRVADTIASGDLKFGKSQAEVKELSDRFYKAITNRYSCQIHQL